jgi:predicted  nucleic acid-binding Zn-ribbon protein
MQMMQQLREELYQVAQRKLNLEKEINSLNRFISALKKELVCRMPVTE